MRIICKPDEKGCISSGGVIRPIAVLPEDAIVVDVSTLTLEPATAAVVDHSGAVKIVPNHIGSGPWYDQEAATADRLTPIEITELGVTPRASWAMTPRAETAKEIAARQKGEAKAAEAERMAATVKNAALRHALHRAGHLDAILAALSDQGVPREASIDLEYAETIRRDAAYWQVLLTHAAMNGADLDEAFALAQRI